MAAISRQQAQEISRRVANELVGQTIYTLNQRKPNKVVSVSEKGVLVNAASDSLVPWDMIDEALDLLVAHGSVSGDELRKRRLSASHRSAFVLAFLSRLPFSIADPDGSAHVLLKDRA
jgi:hypothetical protein